MNNTERGLKIIDIFTGLREHVSKIGGYIDQDRSIIPENPTCGTTACIGGWLADYFKTEVYPHIDSRSYHRLYRDGVKELSNRLDVKRAGVFVHESGLWHNGAGGDVFGDRCTAYRRSIVTKAVGIDDVCRDWIEFGYNLVTKG